jgi:NhaP-type Na+/H+ or K+/H+ antiporter
VASDADDSVLATFTSLNEQWVIIARTGVPSRTILTIAVSILVHGTSATPLLERYRLAREQEALSKKSRRASGTERWPS